MPGWQMREYVWHAHKRCRDDEEWCSAWVEGLPPLLVALRGVLHVGLHLSVIGITSDEMPGINYKDRSFVLGCTSASSELHPMRVKFHVSNKIQCTIVFSHPKFCSHHHFPGGRLHDQLTRLGWIARTSYIHLSVYRSLWMNISW
jgi:hypothetical protein